MIADISFMLLEQYRKSKWEIDISRFIKTISISSFIRYDMLTMQFQAEIYVYVNSIIIVSAFTNVMNLIRFTEIELGIENIFISVLSF